MEQQDFWQAIGSLLGAMSDTYSYPSRSEEEAYSSFNEAVIGGHLVALQHSTAPQRTAAIWMLGILRELIMPEGVIRTTPTLIEGTRHLDINVRRVAIRLLGWLGNDQVTPTLLSSLKDEHPEVRREATESLGRLLGKSMDEQIIPGLKECLHDQSESVRYTALWALGLSGDTGVIPAITPFLKDESREVRRSAARSLGWLGDRRIIPDLVAALDDPSGGVRRDAAAALGRIGDPAGVDPLCRCLNDKRDVVRYTAAWALGQIGDARAVSPLLDALEDQSLEVRRGVIEALGKIGDERALPVLHAALREAESAGDEVMRHVISVVLYEMSSASAPGRGRRFSDSMMELIDPITTIDSVENLGISPGKVSSPEQEPPAPELEVKVEAKAESTENPGTVAPSARPPSATIEKVIIRKDDPPSPPIEIGLRDERQSSPLELASPRPLRVDQPEADDFPETMLGTSEDHLSGAEEYESTLLQAENDSELYQLRLPNGELYILDQDITVIGRSRDRKETELDIDLQGVGGEEIKTVSRRHCRIIRRGHNYFVEDSGSTNGTQLNEQLLEARQFYPLEDQDIIMVGKVRLIFSQA